MSDFGQINSRDLDNYITGHYGEDQFKGEEEIEGFMDSTCPGCALLTDCGVERGELPFPCVPIAVRIEKKNREIDAYYEAMFQEEVD